MKCKYELQNTPLNRTKLQHQKTWVVFNYHSPFIVKIPTYLKTPILILKCCLLIQHFV